jgi:mRNA-degrading endonuclease HigB of HigAB toxin-antitoxin module
LGYSSPPEKKGKKIRDRKIEFDINGGELIIIIIIFYRSTSGRN